MSSPPPYVPPVSSTDRFCMGCGKELPPGALFCPGCGRQTSAVAPPAGTVRCPYCTTTIPPEVRKDYGQNFAVVLIVLLLVFFPLFWVAFFVKDEFYFCASCRMKIGAVNRVVRAPSPPAR